MDLTVYLLLIINLHFTPKICDGSVDPSTNMCFTYSPGAVWCDQPWLIVGQMLCEHILLQVPFLCCTSSHTYHKKTQMLHLDLSLVVKWTYPSSFSSM